MISMLGIYLTGDLIHRHYWKGFFLHGNDLQFMNTVID